MITAAGLAFLVNIGGAAFNWIFRKAGRVATQFVIFALALAVAAYNRYGMDFPVFQSVVSGGVILFSMAVAIYEVILHYFPAFSGPKA